MQDSEIVKYSNGLWFDGEEFHKKEMYSENGMWTDNPSGEPDTVINLNNGFVTLPLGDAHHHILNHDSTINSQIQQFLHDGIYYVMVQDVIFDLSSDIRQKINNTGKLDVKYTKGPLIHPKQAHLEFYLDIADKGLFGKRSTLEDLNGYAFSIINDKEDLERLWPSIKENNPDFIKVILSFSDYYHERVADSSLYSDPSLKAARPGVNPMLLPEIVKKAHADGRRVSCHIETAADFKVAVDAGVDLIAHLPGWQIGERAGFETVDINRWIIDEETARMAAQKGIGVITTTYPKPYMDMEKYGEYMDEINKRNLQILKKHGVDVVIGVDNGEKTTLDEILHLRKYDVFTIQEFINMATEITPRYIFPEKKIGSFENGYEASFLVFKENPLEDLNNLNTISLRIKNGLLIDYDF